MKLLTRVTLTIKSTVRRKKNRKTMKAIQKAVAVTANLYRICFIKSDINMRN